MDSSSLRVPQALEVSEGHASVDDRGLWAVRWEAPEARLRRVARTGEQVWAAVVGMRHHLQGSPRIPTGETGIVLSGGRSS